MVSPAQHPSRVTGPVLAALVAALALVGLVPLGAARDVSFADLAPPAQAGVPGSSGERPVTAFPAPDDEDLPPIDEFLTRMKARLESDDRLLNDFTFVQTVTERERDKRGTLKKSTVKVYEVFPGEDIGYRRLISENGKPTPPHVLAKEDEKQRRKVAEFVGDRQRETPAARDRRLAKERKARKEEQEQIDELFSVMEGRLVGRDHLQGRSTLVLAFSPRRQAKTKTTAGRVFKNIEGRAWFTDDEYRLVKVDMRVIDTISFGLGFFARLHKDTTATFERQLVAPGAWLPARYQFLGTGRLMLLKGLRIDTEVTFSNFRKTTAQTSEQFGDPR